MQVGDRRRPRVVQRRRVQDAVGAGGGAPGALLRPAVARRHQPQVEQPAIGHGAGGGADVVRKLRADQDRRPGCCRSGRGRRRRRGRSCAPPGASRGAVRAGPRTRRLAPASRRGSRRRGRSRRDLRAAARAGDGGLDARRRRRRRGTSAAGSCLQQAQAARPPRAGPPRPAQSPASAASASAVQSRDSASGVFRSSHSASSTAAGTSAAVAAGVRVQRAVPAVELACVPRRARRR